MTACQQHTKWLGFGLWGFGLWAVGLWGFGLWGFGALGCGSRQGALFCH